MTASLTKHFAHKIKAVDELSKIIGPFPREKTVIMCHGTFDVVHPGHLRHLLYAKSKAHVLVASLTADRHITKGETRPHIPQDLRAANLAAYEIVDYVIIDDNATPLENLRKLQPDFFVKGYEYVAGTPNPKTEEERDVIQSYGGEIIFSPGDFVFSSSRLIKLSAPEIRNEKFLALMERKNISFDDLRSTLTKFDGRKTHVVGDTIVDSYTRCSMIGGQTKTPTISVMFESREDYVGGAGIVAKHLRAAGADVTFSTVLGDDSLKEFVLDDLDKANVKVRAFIDKPRPTTNKNAILVGQYRLLKVDTLDNRSIGDNIIEQLERDITSTSADIEVFSDFRHGVFHQGSINRLTAAIPKGCFRVADSQVASRWGNIVDFVGFDLITPNEREARFSLGNQDSNVRSIASAIYEAARCKVLILKLGERGVLTHTRESPTDIDGWFIVDSMARNVVDAVGAGDALLAYATLALHVTASPTQATILGSIAAACECEADGNIPISRDDVFNKLAAIEKECSYG